MSKSEMLYSVGNGDCHYCATPLCISFATLYSVLSFLIVTLNIACIATIAYNKNLHKTKHWILLSNSLIDLVIGSFAISHIIMWILQLCWPFGKGSCLALYAAEEHLLSVSIAHMTTMASERYIHIFYPEFSRKWMKKLLKPVLLSCWILPGLVTYFINFYSENADPQRKAVTECSTFRKNRCSGVGICAQASSIAAEITLHIMLPTFIICFCYGQIIKLGYRRVKKADELPGSLGMTNSAVTQNNFHKTFLFVGRVFRSKECMLIRIFLILLAAFSVCCGAPHIVQLFPHKRLPDEEVKTSQQRENDGSHDRTYSPYFITKEALFCLAYAHSALNPLLLFVLMKSYRRGFKKIFRWICSCCWRAKPGSVTYKDSTSHFSTNNELAKAMETG